MKKWYGMVILILIMVLLLPACGTQPPAATTPKPSAPVTAAPKPQYGGTLKIIVKSDIGTLGAPSEAIGGNYYRVGVPAVEALLRFDEKQRLQPRLVESWDITPDGKNITLHLHKGINFQDGTPFDAETVKYNLENYTSNKIRPAILQNVSSFTVVDPYSIKLGLKAPDSTLLYELSQSGAGQMASPAAIKAPTTPEKMAKDHMVGTGPFKFVSYQTGVNIKYDKFNGYWQSGKPYLDNVEITQIPDPVTSVMAFRSGDAQVLFKITPQDARDLTALGYEIILSDTMPIYYLTPDSANSDSPWSDIRVRQAAEYAIDKKALAQSIGRGYYEPTNQFATTNNGCYVPGLTGRDYNPEKAKQLLAAAGYTQGFKTKLIIGPQAERDVTVALQTYLKEVGIDAELDIADSVRYSTMMNTNGWKNGVMWSDIGLSSFYLPSLSRSLGTTTPSFKTTYRPPGWQSKLDATLSQMDDNKRLAQHQELIKIMYDEAMAIPCWGTPIISAQSKTVHDLNWSKGGQPHFYTIENCWLSK